MDKQFNILLDKQYKILLIDDSEEIRELLRFVFEAKGFEVEESNDGADAISKPLETFDAILLDLQMPNMDGKQFLSVLRKNKNLTVPVVMFTNHEKKGLESELLAAGANKVLMKPARAELLIQEVLDVIENK